MNIVERARRLCLSPDTEWPVIAGERATPGSLLTGYALPLAALSAIGAFVGVVLVNRALGVGAWVGTFVIGLLVSLVGVVLLAVVIDALAPTFGAVKSSINAFKVAAYSLTPVWIGGFFRIVPVVGWLIAWLGGLYALYLLYVGLIRVMKSPADKAVAYTVVIVLVAIVANFLAGVVTATFLSRMLF
jgi:hypothetical protein